ncbi:MAG TPA: amino acid racemase [Candidatus Saccharicenans sp.]|nr:amino acid racemase [Candidatus Saccharicenans sp.]
MNKNRNTTKTVGILGGLGPEATARFFKLIIDNTAAKKDQEHLKIIILDNPSVPDRTAAILYHGPSPLPALQDGLKFLEKAGADLAVIPCLTAHYYFDQLKSATRLKLVNLIEETASYLKNFNPEVKKVGLLATEGTVATGIFLQPFKKKKIEVLNPSEKSQKKIMGAIYGQQGIKAGGKGRKPKRLLVEAADELIEAGTQAIIAGCTEIPLVLRPEDLTVPLIDPLVIGARAIIRRAGGQLKDRATS